MQRISFTVADITNEMRISNYLSSRLGFSSSLITKVKYGCVSLNGTVVTMRAVVKAGDIINVSFPSQKSEFVQPIYSPLDIIFEDEHILLVNKPKDMPTHPSRGNNLITLANAVAYYVKEPFVFRSVNRLDRGTSGIVLIAKNPLAAAILGRDMKERKIEKSYLALVSGIPSPEEGIIDAPIAREREGDIKRVVREDGKRAVSEYKVVKKTSEGNAFCEVKLHTGRTHQIRVHFAHIGHPLVGDFLYGEEMESGYTLISSRLEFTHPISRKKMSFKIDEKEFF